MKFCNGATNFVHLSVITNIEAVRRLNIISDKCNVTGVSTSGNYIHKRTISYMIANL